MPFSPKKKTIGMLKTVPSTAPQMLMAAKSFIRRIPCIRALCPSATAVNRIVTDSSASEPA